MKIKCLFPGNYYRLRNVVVKTSTGKQYALPVGGMLDVDTTNEQWVSFKLDYHRATLSLPEPPDQDSVLVTLKYRVTFPWNFLDVMFKNCMKASWMSKGEFENVSFLLEKQHIEPMAIGITEKLLLGSFIAIMLFYLVTSIRLFSAEATGGFLFLYSLAGLFSLVRIIIARKCISRVFFLNVLVIFAFINLVLVHYQNFHPMAELVLVIISLFILPLLLLRYVR